MSKIEKPVNGKLFAENGCELSFEGRFKPWINDFMVISVIKC